MNSDYVWYTDLSKIFLERDYLLPGQTLDERVDIICNSAERILNKPGFAKSFKDNLKKGWYSLSTPIWNNFGNERGLPISCFGSYIEDDTASIAYAHAEVMMMTKHGGGTSATFGNLRGRGESIKDNGNSDGAVHFMRMFESLINVVSQGRCYVEGTEVLTDSGFKDFRDIKTTDKLAELDEFNNVSFTDQYELVIEDFDGDLVCFKSKFRVDGDLIKVTPNHRMVVGNRKSSYEWEEETEIVLAKDLELNWENKLILAGWAGRGERMSYVDHLQLIHYFHGVYGVDKKIFNFPDKDIVRITELIKILVSNKIKFKFYADEVGNCNFELKDNPGIHELKQLSDWIKLEKINGTWIQDFISDLNIWSDKKFTKNEFYFIQSVVSLGNYQIVIDGKTENNIFNVYFCSLCHEDGSYIEKRNEHYNGKVYCAVVPKGRLLVRYNNKTLICGNTRRGNFAAYLPIDHKDINEFLTLRSEGSPIQDLSFGVTVTDAWMNSMIDGDAEKRKVWAKVLECRTNTGYPYIHFIDNTNNNTVDVYKDKGMKISHSNLCSEIQLFNSPEESFVCDLASMNIIHYDEWKDTNAIELLVYLLDAVMTEFIDKASKIQFMERAVRFAKRQRAIGIGWLGWHSFLQKNMIPFESMEAKFKNVEIAKNIKEKCYAASKKMAEEYGEPELLKGYGRRHTTTNAIAPTKSSAFILGQASEGIEPHRSNYYIKDLQKGKFTIRNPYLQKLLEENGKDTDEVWDSILKRSGSVQHLDFLSQREKDVFKTFAEISQKEIIIQASQRQKYIDQGQSLNLMIHPSIPIKDVNALIIEAWRLGIKSLYYQISVNAAQEFSKNLNSCVSCSA